MDSKLASTERTEFCKRLTKALVAAGVPAKPSIFAREFNYRADGAAVTVHGARKWLMGEAMPTQERLHVLARWLNVPPQWLRYGDDSGGRETAANIKDVIAHEEIVMLGDFRRLDRRSQAVVRDLMSSLLKHHSLRK